MEVDQYRFIYEVEMTADNIEEAEELGRLDEVRDQTKLKRIVGKDEEIEFFDDEVYCL